MIKEYRTKHNLTLAKMERLTGIDSSYINKMEKNEEAYKNKPSYKKVIRIIKMDGRIEIVKAANSYNKHDDIKRGILVNFIYKLLGVKK